MLLRHRQSTTPDHAGISQFSAEAEIAQKYRKAINFLSDAETKITFFHVDSAVLRFSEIYVDVAVIIYSTWVNQPAARVVQSKIQRRRPRTPRCTRSGSARPRQPPPPARSARLSWPSNSPSPGPSTP